MNNLQIGKMYLVKEYFWLLFPTKEVVEPWRAADGDAFRAAYRAAKWYSERYNCNIDVVEPNTCFVLLEHDEKYFKLLDSNGNVGWIYYYDFSNFSNYFELVKE